MLVPVVEAEFAAEAFLDGVPLVVRASLRPLVGVWSLPGLRRLRLGDCFVCLRPFACASVCLAWPLVPFTSFACVLDRVESPEERPAADPFVRLFPVPFDSVASLEEILSRDAASACAVLERFEVAPFAEAVSAFGVRCAELELFCLPRLCVSVFDADPPFDRALVERCSGAVFSAWRGLEGVPLAVLLSAVRAVVDFPFAAVSAVVGVDGFPFAVLSPVRDVRAPCPRPLPEARLSPDAPAVLGLDSLPDAAARLEPAFAVASPALAAALFDVFSVGVRACVFALEFSAVEEARGLESALPPFLDESAVAAFPDDRLGEAPSAAGACDREGDPEEG